MSPSDLVNGLFECLGGVMLFYNCWRVYLDKAIQGVSIGVTSFMMVWGFWNLYFYPHLGQWLSFSGGIIIVIANTLWVAMAWYYTRQSRAPFPTF